VLLLAGLAVQLAPLLLRPLVLTQDGPAHLAGAWVLLHHGDDGPLGQLLREHYEVDLSPVPNMLATLLLAGLLLVVGPGLAEKVLLAGFVVLLLAGLRYALRGVDRRAGWLAAAALPLAGSQLVVYGFYNFCLGTALALVAVGLGLRRRSGWDVRGTVSLVAVLALTWTTHLLPWAGAAALLGALAVARSVVGLRSGQPVAQVAARHLAGPALAVLPTLVLSVRYVLGSETAPGEAVGGVSWSRLGALVTLAKPLVVASWWELLPAVLVAATLGALGLAASRRADPVAPADAPARADRLVLGTATLLSAAAFLLTPSRLGDDYGFLPERLAWFPPLLLTLFCATRLPDRRRTAQLAAGVLVVAASAAVLVRLPTELRDQRYAAEVMSVAADLPAGSTFAVLRFSGYEAALAPLDKEPNPLRHLSSRLAVEVGGVDIGHYEAVYPYFQVRFRDGSVRSAVDHRLEQLDQVPPSVDLLDAGGRLDAVLVVGLDDAEPWVRDARRTAHVLDHLRAGYEEVAVSGPDGHVSVWRLRGSAGG
jgi:hypothetical protein